MIMIKTLRLWLAKKLAGKNLQGSYIISNIGLFNQLMELDMKDLRKFGEIYGAYDTKKSELAREILDYAPEKDIVKFTKEVR